MSPKRIVLFGGGPACLMAALQLAKNHEIILYEKGKAIGRKFLVAGNGGFNLTNALHGEELLKVYSNDSILHNALQDFDTVATRKWLSDLGVETFVGSSGRVFPETGIKPVQVLNKIKAKLEEAGVKIHLNHEFVGFDENKCPLVRNEDGISAVQADKYVFGLGGGSWKRTGTNDKWLVHFHKLGVETIPFESSNCGINTNWEHSFKEKYQGTPLKNIALQVGEKRIRGEALITNYGLEGNAIYPIIPEVRKQLGDKEIAEIYIDFKPDNTVESLKVRTKGNKLKTKNYAFAFKISKAVLSLIKDSLSREEYLDPNQFAEHLKKTPVQVVSLRPVDEAISTVGGISMTEIEPDFSLKKMPNVHLIGEMLDWDAPTGGFLLQACFSMGFSLGHLLE